MAKCLITRPNHDKVTQYLFAWSSKILESEEFGEISFINLQGKDANRKKVESYLLKQSPEAVLFNGHGSSTQINGFKNEVLIESEVNESLLKDKIIYALSCNSASVLGQSAVKKGTKAFIGYMRSFILCTDRNRETTPLKDNIAHSFLEPSNRVSISILKGNSAGEASNKSKEEFKKEIAKYASTKAMPGSDRIASALLWNMSNQVVLGNKDSKISD